ncbi:MAG: acylphosphatase [Oleiphilaceae bacterium]|nr:acylphosphatase [Oleiphilaceae bacterium]
MSHERWQLLIEGHVQGVSYRAGAETTARQLGIKGYVKNLPDGRVEAVAEGAPETLKQYVDWCWQGSPAARVENVTVEKTGATGEFDQFTSY